MDNIIIILILFSIVSSIMKSVTKKQAEQQKRKNQTDTPVRQNAQRAPRHSSEQDKPMPAHAFGHATPSKPSSKPIQERKATAEPSDEGFSTIQPRYEPADGTSSEGTSYNDLIPSWDAPTEVQSEEDHAPVLGLQFNSETLVKSVIFSEILKRPPAAFRRRI